ncbi:hypothetical protein KAR91_27265 [Candidatus Pacearchaeota archaeon]|nr:hypothetical protein [Candidatus Pacearchaeota archaeon]
MSKYVLVSADFPDVDSSERTKIYECLEGKNWKKVEDAGRDISTVWYAFFNDDASDEGAISTSKADFIACAKSYTTPKLVLHVGPNKPTIC